MSSQTSRDLLGRAEGKQKTHGLHFFFGQKKLELARIHGFWPPSPRTPSGLAFFGGRFGFKPTTSNERPCFCPAGKGALSDCHALCKNIWIRLQESVLRFCLNSRPKRNKIQHGYTKGNEHLPHRSRHNTRAHTHTHTHSPHPPHTPHHTTPPTPCPRLRPHGSRPHMAQLKGSVLVPRCSTPQPTARIHRLGESQRSL